MRRIANGRIKRKRFTVPSLTLSVDGDGFFVQVVDRFTRDTSLQNRHNVLRILCEQRRK